MQASETIGFIISKIEALSYQTTFDLESSEGEIILNVSYFPEKNLEDALKAMKPVFQSPYVMSDRILLKQSGEKIGNTKVPEGMVGFGTVCSVTINGIFLKAGIPVVSRYGGLLQVEGKIPWRFVSLISYEGSSLDPIVVFIKSRMTTVLKAVRNQTGNVLASFREIPVASLQMANDVCDRLKVIGIGGILAIGNPNQALFQMPVSVDRAGMVVVGGLNPIAAVEEAGIRTENLAMALLYPYSGLQKFKELLKGI